MADGRRTAEEREEARREREAARAARAADQRGEPFDFAEEDSVPPTEAAEPARAGEPTEVLPADADEPPRDVSDDAARPFPGDEAPAAASSREIKSFPSPPDPDFYVLEDELEMPVGTKRVRRLGHRTVKPRPARRRRAVKPRKREPASGRRRWLGRVLSLIALLVAAALAW